MKVKKTVITALFAALTCVATFIIRIPSPLGGYINLGDCMVLISAWFLGPVYGFSAAALGSALADLSSGYVLYAPTTLIIKGIMAVVAHFIFKSLSAKKPIFGNILSGIAAEIIMVGGYYIFEGFIYGFTASLVNIPSNSLQGAAGIICAAVLYSLADKPLRKNLSDIFKKQSDGKDI